MLRFLVFLFPGMMDMVLGTVFFVTAVRLAEGGAGGLKVSLTAATWAIIYSLTSLILGMTVTVRNSVYLLFSSGIIVALAAIGFIVFPGLDMQFLFIFLTGIGTALFFAPFQVFMKAAENGRPSGLVRSIGFYIFSWSLGLAGGPLLSGLIWNYSGWRNCYLLNVIFGIVIAVSVVFLKFNEKRSVARVIVMPAHNNKASGTEIDYSKMPDLAWLGWLAAGVGCISVAIVRCLFPYKAELLALSKDTQGLILGIISFTQAFVALALCRSRYWMYKPLPIAAFSVAGVAGLLLLGFAMRPEILYLAAFLYGIYTASFSFYLIFHSLVHRERSSLYVAINEIVVGVTSIIGPLGGGYLADRMSSRDCPFYAVALILAPVIVVQVLVHRSKCRKERQ